MSKESAQKLKPMPGYVVIKPAESEKQTASGIILPSNDEQKQQYGEVLAVGESIWDSGKEIKVPVKVGARVVYKKWGGEDIEIGEEKYQICEFKNLLAEIVS
jgi:chaperonin GroES